MYDQAHIENDKKIDYLRELEETASIDKKIINTESGFTENKSNFILANSDGFCNGYKSSSFTASCVAVAKNENSMERDYEFTSKCHLEDISNPSELGKNAGLLNMSHTPIIEVSDLSVSFFNKEKEVSILNNLSFAVKANSITAVVGESGSGKSIASLSIMGLLPKIISKNTSGSIKFNGNELTGLNDKEIQNIRGNEIAMIFQEPMSSLNPSIRCGKQVGEIIQRHTKLSKSEIKEEVISLFQKVKLPNPERIYKAYPHQISGGQKQRVMIAMAISCSPKLLIADEPTTA